RFLISHIVQIIRRRTKLRILRGTSIIISAIISAITAVSIRAAVTAAAIGTAVASLGTVGGCSVFLLLHDLFICLLYLLEFLFCFCFIGIIDIGVRMVFPAQRTVSFLDFLRTGIPGHSQHLIWICHQCFFSSSSLSRLRLSISYFVQIPAYNIFLKMSTFSSIGSFSNALEASAVIISRILSTASSKPSVS